MTTLHAEQRDSHNRNYQYPNVAIGIIASESNEITIKQTVRRANELGYPTLVASEERDTFEFIQGFDVNIVTTSRIKNDGRDLTGTLATAARESGFDGLILVDEIEEGVDFASSLVAFFQCDSYIVPAVKKQGTEQTKDHGPVIAGIPAFNEAGSIGRIVDATTDVVNEVVVVDDGSDDQTERVADRHGATVIRHSTNCGKGAAVKTVLNYADRQSCSALVILDGDGQHLPEDIPTVIEPILSGQADMVIGNRYLHQETGSETPLYRRVGQRTLDLSISLLFGISVMDTQSGFRAFSPEAIENISISTDGMGVETEMLRAAQREGLDIAERPISVRYNGINGQTYNPIRHGVSVLGHTLRLVLSGVMSPLARAGTEVQTGNEKQQRTGDGKYGEEPEQFQR